MDRLLVEITTATGTGEDAVGLPPAVLQRLGLRQGPSYPLRFGTRRVAASFRADARMSADRMRVPAPLARRLLLPARLAAAVRPAGGSAVDIGPLIGILVPRSLWQAMRKGGLRPPYRDYVQSALETGAVPVLFAHNGVDPRAQVVRGLHPDTRGAGPGRLVPAVLPVPRVAFHALNSLVRQEAERFESAAPRLGCQVVDRWRRIPKLEAYRVLQRDKGLARYVPATVPLTPATLRAALTAHDDLYFKPDTGARGEGVYRLTRLDQGWLLTSATPLGIQATRLAHEAAVRAALAPLLTRGTAYLVQEGLPLATFLGNRFDLRGLVQKDGRGRWTLSGLVARVAPLGSPITSPLSGALVAPPEAALQRSFPSRWREVLAEVREVAVAAAAAIDRALGPRFEMGVDMGVLRDGSVRIIEVNGAPRKTSLEMLGDPLTAERMYRLPIHYAISLALRGDE